jgi:hypothetical protein
MYSEPPIPGKTDCPTLKMEALRSFETSGTSHPKPLRHNPENLNSYCYIRFSPFLSKSLSLLWRHDLPVFPWQPPVGAVELPGLQITCQVRAVAHAESVSRIAVWGYLCVLWFIPKRQVRFFTHWLKSNPSARRLLLLPYVHARNLSPTPCFHLSTQPWLRMRCCHSLPGVTFCKRYGGYITTRPTVCRRRQYAKYRVIKKSLCTWRLQYRKLQAMFKVSPASLQTFIDKTKCVPEDRQGQGDTRLTLTPSVIPNSNYVIMVSDWNCLKCFCVFFFVL